MGIAGGHEPHDHTASGAAESRVSQGGRGPGPNRRRGGSMRRARDVG